MKAWILGTSVVAIMVIIVIVLNVGRTEDGYEVDWELATLPPQEVTIAQPSSQHIVKTISAPGTVECRDEAEVASEVVGRVIEVNVEEGDLVKEGKILVRLDDADLSQIVASSEARVKRIESLIKQEEAELNKARRDLSLNLQLLQRDAVEENVVLDGQTMVDTMLAALNMANADLADARANLSRSQAELDHTIIKAPMDGVVGDLSVEEGEVIIPGTTNLPGTVLMTINDLSHLQVRTRIDQSDIRWVKGEQSAKIYLRGDRLEPVPGKVSQIAPKGTNEGDVVSFETLIRVGESSENVRVGMTATIEVEVDETDSTTCLPVEAIVHRKLKDLPQTDVFKDWAQRTSTGSDSSDSDAARYLKVIFVVRDGVAKALPVETGLSDDRFVEVLEGVTPDDQVITGPFRVLELLKDGQAVLLPGETTESD